MALEAHLKRFLFFFEIDFGQEGWRRSSLILRWLVMGFGFDAKKTGRRMIHSRSLLDPMLDRFAQWLIDSKTEAAQGEGQAGAPMRRLFEADQGGPPPPVLLSFLRLLPV